jgi:hypothetical protein
MNRRRHDRVPVTAAAARLNLSGARVRQLIAQGRIKAVKITPRMWMVTEPVKVLPPRSG